MTPSGVHHSPVGCPLAGNVARERATYNESPAIAEEIP
jgi:hypothetical protein